MPGTPRSPTVILAQLTKVGNSTIMLRRLVIGEEVVSRQGLQPDNCNSSPSYGRISMIQFICKKRTKSECLSFYHPSLLCCPHQMLAMTELSQQLVLSSKTFRPIIPHGARCVGHVKIMWSAVFLLAPHSQFAEKARPHLWMDEPKRPMPVRRQLTQFVLVKLILIGLVLALGM